MRTLLCCLRCALKPSASGLRISKLYQLFRSRDGPYGLQVSLCTLTSYFCSSVTQLLNEINTRYGWLVKPYPTGTFTLQDTLSFAQRDNEAVDKHYIAPRPPAPDFFGLVSCFLCLRYYFYGISAAFTFRSLFRLTFTYITASLIIFSYPVQLLYAVISSINA